MKIGVIGGNGVAATNRLCDMVERKVTSHGAFRDAHHPEMIVWQATNVPSRSTFLEGRGADWRPDYIRIAKTFKGIGCNLCCMCCNTAHYAVEDVERESGLEFINILEEVALRAKEIGHGRYEVFCSDGARKFDLYGAAFAKTYPDCELVYPSEERQRLVTEVICGVKTKTRIEGDSNLLKLNSLIETAAAPVILGCTDLRVAYSNDVQPIGGKLAIDSLECLADAIVRRFEEEVNR